MFFVVTTGRSGSQTLAHILNQHPLCHCLHEPHLILIKLSAERYHGLIEDDELRAYLFEPRSIFPHRVGLQLYGESDQRLSYFIPLLAELGTVARFVWLIRDGRDVVASTFSRGWYASEESVTPSQLWAKYRIQGDLCGDVEPRVWQAMSPFEKCCWYWSHTNRTIARDLESLDTISWMMLKLEELSSRLQDLLGFLDLPYYPLRTLHANKNPTPTYRFESWSDEEQEAFDFWCGQYMDKWYPGWREEGRVQQTSQIRAHSVAADILPTVGSHVKWFAGIMARRAISKIFPSSKST